MVELKPLGPAKWELPTEGKIPVWIYANKAIADSMGRDRTCWQAQNVAKLPGIIKASEIMPDGHEGYGFPIGGVAAFDMEEGIISPGGVGYDINCGVRLILTNLTVKEVKPKISELMGKLFENIPSGVGSKGRIRLTREDSLRLSVRVRSGQSAKTTDGKRTRQGLRKTARWRARTRQNAVTWR